MPQQTADSGDPVALEHAEQDRAFGRFGLHMLDQAVIDAGKEVSG